MEGGFKPYFCIYAIPLILTGCALIFERPSESGRGSAYCYSLRLNCPGSYTESVNLLGEKECTCVENKIRDKIILGDPPKEDPIIRGKNR